MVTKRECELCRSSLDLQDEGIKQTFRMETQAIRREIKLVVGVSTTAITIFISILAILLNKGVI